MTLLNTIYLRILLALFLSSNLFLHAANIIDENFWSYKDADSWGYSYPYCEGDRQSPINLSKRTAFSATYIPPLNFTNYDKALYRTLSLYNNGHSVELNIPAVEGGGHPTISGGLLKTEYEAILMHFHWGSRRVRGSEHSIDNEFFDMEVHVIHKNIQYASMQEALQNSDGLAAIAFFVKIDNNGNLSASYDEILEKLPEVRIFNSKVNLEGAITLNSLLPSNTYQFFAYDGSLTAPPCSETVIWHILTQPLSIQLSQMAEFWKLLDVNYISMTNTFRRTQPLRAHKVWYMRD